MPDRPSNPSSGHLSRAAQYLRMSTEHHQYSIANQSAAIALHAAAHNIGIVRSSRSLDYRQPAKVSSPGTFEARDRIRLKIEKPGGAGSHASALEQALESTWAAVVH
jgi:hypothetical protein